MVLKNFEIEVIKALCSSSLTEEQLRIILSESNVINIENTGVGYHLYLEHPNLPEKRVVCGQPSVTGQIENILVGFMIFLGNKSLHIDCHQINDMNLPNNFRDLDIDITTNL